MAEQYPHVSAHRRESSCLLDSAGAYVICVQRDRRSHADEHPVD